MVQPKDKFVLKGLAGYQSFNVDRFLEDYDLIIHGGLAINGEWRAVCTLKSLREDHLNNDVTAVLIVENISRDSVNALACTGTYKVDKESLKASHNCRISYHAYGLRIFGDEHLMLEPLEEKEEEKPSKIPVYIPGKKTIRLDVEKTNSDKVIVG